MNEEEATAELSLRVAKAISPSFVAADWTLRDDLEDALAEVLYDHENGGEVAAWDQLDDDEAEEYLITVRAYMPLIVKFVAEWLEGKSESLDDIGPVELPRTLAQEWQEDMA